MCTWNWRPKHSLESCFLTAIISSVFCSAISIENPSIYWNQLTDHRNWCSWPYKDLMSGLTRSFAPPIDNAATTALKVFRLGDSMSAQKATTSGLYRQKPPRPTHQKKGANTTGPLGTWAHTEQAWISHPNLNLSDPSTQSLGESGNGCLPHCSVAVQTTTTTTPPFLHHHHVSDRICVCWVRRSLL